MDRRIIEEIRTGTAKFGETYKGGGKGIIDSQQAVGGWPELRSHPRRPTRITTACRTTGNETMDWT